MSDHGMESDAALAGDQEAEPWEPPVITSHLAYFFIPLPDHLALPAPYVFEAYESVPHSRMVQEQLPPMCVGASLCFHQIDAPPPHHDQIIALFELAAQALPDPSRPPREKESPQVSDWPSTPNTIVEVAVPVDLEGNDEEFDDRISDAFDKGVEYVREFQRAYWIAKHAPIRLVTRESLPFAIPHSIRKLWDEEGNPAPFEAPLSMYLLNMNIPGAVTDWNKGDEETLQTAVSHRARSAAFASYSDFVREANVALFKDGSHQSAVVFAAIACEVLFDDLLSHLMWEESVRPELASLTFDSKESISKRVKSQYSGRLGGTWSLDKPGPINRWATAVAQLRNRVVHSGYEPTLDEARSAIDAVQGLVEFMADRVASRISKYPRTAIVLSGRVGLERRGKWSKRLQNLLESKEEVSWRSTFPRWRSAMQRAGVEGQVGSAPTPIDSPVMIVMRASGSEQWIVHDVDSGMAAVIEFASVFGIDSAQTRRIEYVRKSRRERQDLDTISMTILGAHVKSVPKNSWIPDYRLVPGLGVMVDGNDLDPA